MPEANQTYRTVRSEQTYRMVVERSVFIAHVRRVQTRELAKAWIKECKQQWKDASHNCSAWVVGRNAEHQFCDDNGEPHGSAGRPILGAILSLELTNVAVVVTRHFGGRKLGVRGLIDAYGEAARQALVASEPMEVIACRQVQVLAGYPQADRIQYLIRDAGARVLDQVFAEDVEMRISIPESEADDFVMRLRPFAKEVHLV